MIYYFIVTVGLHWLLKYGTIFNIPRRWITKVPFFAELFKCSLCLGFWCGLIIALYEEDIDVYTFPIAAAGICWLLDTIINVLQSIEIKLDSD